MAHYIIPLDQETYENTLGASWGAPNELHQEIAMQTLPQRLGKAIGEHLKLGDEIEGIDRTESDVKARILELGNRTLALSGKPAEAALIAAFKAYTHVPSVRGPRNGNA